jgi:hypothetical protein
MECRLCRVEERVKHLEKEVDGHREWLTFITITTIVGVGSILVAILERKRFT